MIAPFARQAGNHTLYIREKKGDFLFSKNAVSRKQNAQISLDRTRVKLYHKSYIINQYGFDDVGYDATRVIRELKDPEKRTIPIAVMAANAFDEDKKKAFAFGMDGFIAKPVFFSARRDT